jgi:ABC-type multidrug transport system fused ATPase/permease subunit
VGIQKVLEYLESEGEGQTFKPILWIALLLVGPTIGSLAIQGYVFLNTRFLVRSEAILTQLLFDHALRLRMKDSTDDQSDGSDDKVPTVNVENVDSTGENGDSSDTEVGSSNGSGTKTNKKDNVAKAEEEAAKSNGQGLAGKINVLISSDVESILGALHGRMGSADNQRDEIGH